MSAFETVMDRLRDNGLPMRHVGGTVRTRGLCHDGDSPDTVAISLGRDKRVLVHCHKCGDNKDFLTAIGLTEADLYDDPRKPEGAFGKIGTVVKSYPYADSNGVIRYYVDRYFPKTFRPRMADGGKGFPREARLLYRLPAVLAEARAGGTVFVVEGEKDADNLTEKAGVTATTMPGGTGMGWQEPYSQAMLGVAEVVVIADNDPDGQGMKHARKVAASLGRHGVPHRIVLPAVGKDISDHLAAGLGYDDLQPIDQDPAEEYEDEPPPEDEPPVDREAIPRTWQAQDLEDVLNGTYKPPRPTVGHRDDGVGLFYPGRVNTVICETEGGKTWLALTAAIQEMNAGNHVIDIDFEDDRGGTVSRLLVLGATPDVIRRYFHYVRPENRPTPADIADLAQLLALKPTLAIIDGVTEAMTLYGQEINDNNGAAAFGRELLRPIKNSGAAVVTLDHVVKSTDGRGQGRYAIGAVHKLNGLDGVQYTMENIQPFGIGLVGRTRVRISKDRPGQIRKNSVPGDRSQLRWFMDLVLTSHDETFAEVNLYPPIQHAEDPEEAAAEKEREEREEAQILAAEEKVLDVLRKASEPISQKAIIDLVPGRASVTRRAVTRLVHGGRVIGTQGARNALMCSLPSPDEGGDS